MISSELFLVLTLTLIVIGLGDVDVHVFCDEDDDIIDRNQKLELVSDFEDDEADELDPDGSSRGCISDWTVSYLMLTIQWGPGVCYKNLVPCAIAPKPEFTIHGLWPTKKDKDSPCYCCNDKEFRPNKLQQRLYTDMIKSWPSFTNRPNEAFWNYQWNKHGSCANKVGLDTAEKYFAFAMSKFNHLQLNKLIKDNGIVPGNDKQYETRMILELLRQKHGADVNISCYYDHNKGKSYLVELFACYNAQYRPVDCPTVSNRCLTRITLPTSKNN